jgi:hypothetical protein
VVSMHPLDVALARLWLLWLCSSRQKLAQLREGDLLQQCLELSQKLNGAQTLVRDHTG